MAIDIKEAVYNFLNRWFTEQQEKLGNLPQTVYIKEQKSLHVGECDEDGYIQWMYKEAEDLFVEGLCIELLDFYSSYYYCNLEGDIETDEYNYSFIFPAVYNKLSAINQAKFALERGKKLFSQEDIAIIASCENDNIDGLDLCYNQYDGSLFIYDFEFDRRIELDFTLVDLFEDLQPFIF